MLQDIVNRFNFAIKQKDLDLLSSLMTEDHLFADSVGSIVQGKQKVLNAWEGFFSAFPSYENIFDHLVVQNELVVIIGKSVCTENSELDGPALWTAKISNGLISEWRVYDDTEENRHTFGLKIDCE